MIFPLAPFGDLSRQDWSDKSFAWIVELIRGPLIGLEALHAEGLIHRDVTMKNILVTSMNPPKAAIADFGETVHAQFATDSRIGPIPTLAPEVDAINNADRYSNKIDIWSFGLACLYLLFPDARGLRNERVKEEKYSKILGSLKRFSEDGGHGKLFADLLRKMLNWDPSTRISARDALSEPFFQLCAPVPASNSPTSDRPAKMMKTGSVQGHRHQQSSMSQAQMSKPASQQQSHQPMMHGNAPPARNPSNTTPPARIQVATQQYSPGSPTQPFTHPSRNFPNATPPAQNQMAIQYSPSIST